MSRPHPLVCAHRGRSGVFPENTLAAFEAAVALGADFIECDVHSTVDGQIVVMHDANADRTTDGTGSIEAMTLGQVRALDAGSWRSAEYAGERVPTLAEVLESIAPRCVVDIEIKQRGIGGQVAREIAAAGATRQVTVISFSSDDLAAAKAANRDLSCGLLTASFGDGGTGAIHALISTALAAGCNFISCHHGAVTAELVRECHLAGLVIMAWTMDEAADIQRMIDLRADALVSNYPERVMEML